MTLRSEQLFKKLLEQEEKICLNDVYIPAPNIIQPVCAFRLMGAPNTMYYKYYCQTCGRRTIIANSTPFLSCEIMCKECVQQFAEIGRLYLNPFNEKYPIMMAQYFDEVQTISTSGNIELNVLYQCRCCKQVIKKERIIDRNGYGHVQFKKRTKNILHMCPRFAQLLVLKNQYVKMIRMLLMKLMQEQHGIAFYQYWMDIIIDYAIHSVNDIAKFGETKQKEFSPIYATHIYNALHGLRGVHNP